MKRLTALLVAALFSACGGSDDPAPDDRKTIIPVVCTSASGVAIPGVCV